MVVSRALGMTDTFVGTSRAFVVSKNVEYSAVNEGVGNR